MNRKHYTALALVLGVTVSVPSEAMRLFTKALEKTAAQSTEHSKQIKNLAQSGKGLEVVVGGAAAGTSQLSKIQSLSRKTLQDMASTAANAETLASHTGQIENAVQYTDRYKNAFKRRPQTKPVATGPNVGKSSGLGSRVRSRAADYEREVAERAALEASLEKLGFKRGGMSYRMRVDAEIRDEIRAKRALSSSAESGNSTKLSSAGSGNSAKTGGGNWLHKNKKDIALLAGAGGALSGFGYLILKE